MAVKQQRIILSTFRDDNFTDDDLDNYIIDTAECNNREVSADDITDEMRQEEFAKFIEMEFDDFNANFRDEFNSDEFLLAGTLGLWNGTPKAYKRIRNLRDFTDAISGYDDIKIYETRKGRTHVELYHHDGTHHMELRRLTDAGKTYLENCHGYYVDVYEHIAEKPSYTKNARIAEHVFGKLPKGH